MSSSSSSSIHSAHAGSSPPVDRGERKNLTFSKIIRVVLATLGIIASYAFLPPVGATIVSSVIILATILSFFDAETDTTAHRRPWHRRLVTVGDYVLPTRWSFFRAPRRDYRIILLDNEWIEMGSPSFDGWASMGRPTFASWRSSNPTPRRPVVRESASASAPRGPVGTGGVTPSVASSAASRRGGSYYYVPTLPPRPEWRSERPSDSSPRGPVGTGGITPTSIPRATSPSTSSDDVSSSFAPRASIASSPSPYGNFSPSYSPSSSSSSSSSSPSLGASIPRSPPSVRLDSSMSGSRVPVGGRR